MVGGFGNGAVHMSVDPRQAVTACRALLSFGYYSLPRSDWAWPATSVQLPLTDNQTLVGLRPTWPAFPPFSCSSPFMSGRRMCDEPGGGAERLRGGS